MFSLLLVSVFVFSSSNVNAATICTGGDTQVILSLYSPENSHGATAGETSATEKICYDILFNGKYNGVDSQKCDSAVNPQNIVLRLSSNNNAHAESKDKSSPTPTYNVNICYGNLKCRVIDTSVCDPAKEEVMIVSLSSETNAHMNSPSAATQYPYKVCCSSPSASPNNPPFVTITSPLQGAKFSSGANIEIKANAGDYDVGGSIVRVYFRQNGVVIGEDSTPSGGEFSIIWNNVQTGTYVLTAEAYDNRGASKISNPVTIYVESPIIPPGPCNPNNIKEQGEQCDAGPNGGTDTANCPNPSRCSNKCVCDNLANSCQSDYELTGECKANSPSAYRTVGCLNYKEKDLISSDQIQCYEVRCECYLSGGNECKVSSTYPVPRDNAPSFCRGGGNIPPPPIKKCKVDSTELKECIEGYREIKITYTSDSDSSCATMKTVPCGRNVAYLPFMGIWQIAAAIVIIGVIYYFVFLRNRKGKKVKGK